MDEYKRRMEDGLRMADSPGKFEGELFLTELLWHLTMEGGQDDEVGDFAEVGFWSGLFDWSGNPEEMIQALNRMAKDMEEDPLTPEEQALIRDSAGAIITEDDQGFVYGKYSDTKKELDEAWEQVQAAAEELPEEEFYDE